MLLVRHELIYVYVSRCILSRGLTVYTCELGQCESVFQHWTHSGALTKCQMENRFSPGQMVLDRAKFRLGEQEYPVELVMSSMTTAGVTAPATPLPALAHFKFLQMLVLSCPLFSIGHMTTLLHLPHSLLLLLAANQKLCWGRDPACFHVHLSHHHVPTT